jgi:hypothetical protein
VATVTPVVKKFLGRVSISPDAFVDMAEGRKCGLAPERNRPMSTTLTTTAAITPTDLVDTSVTPRTRVWRVGITSGAVAAVATCVTVLAARAVDVEVAIDGERVPLDGFALFTMVGALIGVALAKTLSRRAQKPRTTFVRTTVALTILSIVPDFIVPASIGSRLVLAATHVVAAAIIVPALSARLHD